MQSNKYKILVSLIFLIVLLAIAFLNRSDLLPFLVPVVFAHCDTMDGPVIQAAKRALETANVDLVLIWVKPKDEELIREAFKNTLAVHKLNPQAKQLADMYFFETLVRIHRAGEGAPYTGLKPAGTEVSAGIAAAEKALETESVDSLVKKLSVNLTQGIYERFNRAIEKKKYVNESVEAGRQYIEAYVEFVHYVDKLHMDISGKIAQHSELEDMDTQAHHEH